MYDQLGMEVAFAGQSYWAATTKYRYVKVKKVGNSAKQK